MNIQLTFFPQILTSVRKPKHSYEIKSFAKKLKFKIR